MSTANFEETPPPAPPRRGFRRPADHYSSASPESAFPQWLSFGCGGLALLALIVVFAGGAWLGSGGFSQFIEFTLGMSISEMRGQYTAEVTEQDRRKLDAEVETMLAHIRAKRVATTSLRGFLQEMSRAGSDRQVTPAEVDRLVAEAAKVNKSAKR